MQRGWPWAGLAAGLLLGLADLALLRALGVSMMLAGRDVTAPVMLLFGLSFGALGFVIGRLAQARAALRRSAGRIAAQYEALRAGQERLVQAEKLASLGRMAAGVAHEVRNPLGVIRAAAVLIDEGLPPRAADERQAAAFIREEVDRLDGFVRAILDFSRPVAPRVAEVSLAEALPRAARLAGIAAAAVDEGSGEGTVRADPDLLVQVLAGLLDNAEKAGASRALLRCGREQEGGWIEVADDGPGVAEPEEQAIFEPFFTTRAQGTGLGLAMARRVAEAHGGALAYRRGAGLGPGGAGACFRLTLPAQPPQEAR